MKLCQAAGGGMMDVLGSQRADSQQEIEARAGLLAYCFNTRNAMAEGKFRNRFEDGGCEKIEKT
eukprot:6873182-Alexandrium_andersonii.AAC.1